MRYTGRSPSRLISAPPAGANTNRMKAKTLTIMDAALIPTSKLRAYCGRIGATRPNPIAMTKAAATSTQISRGMRGRARSPVAVAGGGLSVTMARPV